MMEVKFHCDEECNFHKGYGVRAFTYTDYSIEMHSHDFYEVNIVFAGSGTHCIKNREIRVCRGDVFVIPPMVPHAYTDTNGLEVYHILLQKSFLDRNKAESEQVRGFLQLTEIEPFLRGSASNASGNFYLRLSYTQLMELNGELSFIDELSPFSWEECSAMKYHATWKILYWLSELLNRQINSAKDTPKMKYEMQILGALEYIHNNYGEKITIDDICREVYLSRSTFLRAFRSVCGMPPMEYLNSYRCRKALEQLGSSGCSKTETAHSCGFFDLSHMQRMLKKHGLTL